MQHQKGTKTQARDSGIDIQYIFVYGYICRSIGGNTLMVSDSV